MLYLVGQDVMKKNLEQREKRLAKKRGRERALQRPRQKIRLYTKG
jgi:hypothetical protein